MINKNTTTQDVVKIISEIELELTGEQYARLCASGESLTATVLRAVMTGTLNVLSVNTAHVVDVHSFDAVLQPLTGETLLDVSLALVQRYGHAVNLVSALQRRFDSLDNHERSTIMIALANKQRVAPDVQNALGVLVNMLVVSAQRVAQRNANAVDDVESQIANAVEVEVVTKQAASDS